MTEKNLGCEFDLGWLNKVHVNLSAVKHRAATFQLPMELSEEFEAAWLLRALTCIDLTTLGGDDTYSNVSKLCYKAAKPLPEYVLKELEFGYECPDCPIRTAAVCVYPARVQDAVRALKEVEAYDKINVASVATGFPSGQTPLKTRLDEIRFAVENGATEIDIVINRTLALTGLWEKLYREIQQMKEACGPDVHMKSILATGELGNMNNVFKASLVAMMAGSDFIKTSTGKEALNATIPFGIVMCRAIREYQRRTGYQVGLKPAGGIRTCNEALSWLMLMFEELGMEWCYSGLFRIGASGLLNDIEARLCEFVNAKKIP